MHVYAYVRMYVCVCVCARVPSARSRPHNLTLRPKPRNANAAEIRWLASVILIASVSCVVGFQQVHCPKMLALLALLACANTLALLACRSMHPCRST
jgi:hypothetical protein